MRGSDVWLQVNVSAVYGAAEVGNCLSCLVQPWRAARNAKVFNPG